MTIRILMIFYISTGYFMKILLIFKGEKNFRTPKVSRPHWNGTCRDWSPPPGGYRGCRGLKLTEVITDPLGVVTHHMSTAGADFRKIEM